MSIREKTCLIYDNFKKGIKEINITNWDGLCYKVPREVVKNPIKELSDNPQLYIAIGEEEIYVGMSDKDKRCGQNIDSHHQLKDDFWNYIFKFASSKSTLNTAKLKYLERKVYDEALKSGRFSLKNTTPSSNLKSKSERSEMDEYFDYIKYIIDGIFNVNLFKPLKEIKEYKKKDSNIEDNIKFYIFEGDKRGGWNAKATIDEFGKTIVFQGSKITNSDVPSFKSKESYYKLKYKLIEDGIIKDCLFTRNYEFNSMSAASSIVAGSSINGRNIGIWKNKNKKGDL